MSRLQRLVAPALALVLLLGAGTAFVVAQAKKAEKPPVFAPRFVAARTFSPAAVEPARRVARLSFRVRHAGRVDAAIVDRHGRTVRVLRRRARVRAGGVVGLSWDGRRSGGGYAPDGRYRLRVTAYADHWDRVLPNTIVLDRTPPVVTAQPPRGVVLGPAFDAPPLRFTAVVSEPATLRLEVWRQSADGRRTVVYRDPRPGLDRSRVLHWDGRIAHRPARPGTYVVGWRALDPAGNRVEVPRPGVVEPGVVVRVRGVELTPDLRVLTPAGQATLRSAPATGPKAAGVERTDAPERLRLPPPARAGLYAVSATAGPYEAWTAQAVPGRAAVLVLVPTYTWQARNGYDEDGDGRPDVPPGPLALTRPLGANGRRALDRLVRTIAPLTARVPRPGAVTDARVEAAGVPRTARVLVLANEAVWTAGLRARLEAFRRRGGRIVLLGERPTQRADRRSRTLVGLHDEAWRPTGARVFGRVGPALRGVAGARP